LLIQFGIVTVLALIVLGAFAVLAAAEPAVFTVSSLSTFLLESYAILLVRSRDPHEKSFCRRGSPDTVLSFLVLLSPCKTILNIHSAPVA